MVSDGGGTCPDRLGDPSAPGVLTIRSEHGEREVRFPEAVLLLEDDALRLRLPRFASNEYVIVVEDVPEVRREYEAVLLGQFVSTECLPLPAFESGERTGTLRLEQFELDGRFTASFRIASPRDSRLGYFGTVHGTVVDVRGREPAVGSVVVVNGEQLLAVGARVRHQPQWQLLEMQLDTRTQLPALRLSIAEFDGAPGVYLAEPCIDAICESHPPERALLAIVHEFGDGRVRLEVRDVPRSSIEPSLPDGAAASRTGELRARVAGARVALIPALEPVAD